MTNEINAHSFDGPRDRVAPAALSGHWANGADTTLPLSEPTLVVAIKPDCDGCREFINADLVVIGVPVIVISAEDDASHKWSDASQPVFVSPTTFRVLDIRWPPFYVLIDPTVGRVLSEGVLFGVSQVASEIAPFLNA